MLDIKVRAPLSASDFSQGSDKKHLSDEISKNQKLCAANENIPKRNNANGKFAQLP